MGSPRRRGHRIGQAGATAAAPHGRPPVVWIVDDRPPACPAVDAWPDVWRCRSRRYRRRRGRVPPPAVAHRRRVDRARPAGRGGHRGAPVRRRRRRRRARRRRSPSSPRTRCPTFDEATYTTFDGEEVPLSSVRGTPTVVNFFSSTCTPCITEMPAFEEVYQDVQGSGEVAFLGLAVADRTDDALALVEQTGVTYPTAEDKDAVGDQRARRARCSPPPCCSTPTASIVSTHAGELTADELRTPARRGPRRRRRDRRAARRWRSRRGWWRP